MSTKCICFAFVSKGRGHIVEIIYNHVIFDHSMLIYFIEFISNFPLINIFTLHWESHILKRDETIVFLEN